MTEEAADFELRGRYRDDGVLEIRNPVSEDGLWRPVKAFDPKYQMVTRDGTSIDLDVESVERAQELIDSIQNDQVALMSDRGDMKVASFYTPKMSVELDEVSQKMPALEKMLDQIKRVKLLREQEGRGEAIKKAMTEAINEAFRCYEEDASEAEMARATEALEDFV